MHESLEQLHSQYAAALAGLSCEALEIHPGEDEVCWSARQIIDHLVLTYRTSSGVLQERVEKGRPTQKRPTLKHLVPRMAVLGFGYMPRGRVAPAMVMPQLYAAERLGGTALSDSMKIELEIMDELLILCEQQFGAQQMATHEVLGPLSAAQWRRFHVTHGRHHFKQMRRIRLRP